METVKAARLRRDVVSVEGADARAHLQSQLTQDVDGLDVGEAAWSFLLDPKASIIALLRITRASDTRYLLDTDVGWGSVIREALDGFLFRMDVAFTSDTWDHIALRGPGSEEVTMAAPIEATVRWGDITGLDIVGPDLEDPDGIEMLPESMYDSLRIWAGWPAMGREIVARTTPAMTGLTERAISFSKGCYPGQEFVARVHYRHAAPPRRIVHVRFHPCAKVEEGSELLLDGEVVGSLTSVAGCQPFALATLKRSIAVPAEVTCAGCPATVDALPATLASA